MTFPIRNRSRYLFSLFIVLFAYWLRQVFLFSLADKLPYVTFYPAVIIAAIYGGFFAGITALLFSLLLVWFCIISWMQPLSFLNWIIHLAFILISTMLCYSIETIYLKQSRDLEQTRKLREINEELAQQKQNYQTLIGNLPFMILRFGTLYQSTPVHFDSKQYHDCSPEILAQLLPHVKSVFSTKQSTECELVIPCQENFKSYQSIFLPEFEKTGQVCSVLVLTRDQTLQKQLQKDLLKLDRLNTIGEMAASIGHEIRNPLTTVRGYLQYFISKEKIKDFNDQFTVMIEELDRANVIITEFLSLAKDKALHMEYCNLNDTISTIAPLLQADALHSGHNLQLDLGNIPAIHIDKKEIRQVLLNLFRNSVEATPPNGTIRIQTRVVNNQVTLSVQDNGSGISQEILDKIGLPFTTTKDKGTGLGLSVCYRIAERHKAKLKIDTGIAGTTVSMIFPQ